jgi:predicted enzyme related to lactoylglutathione lyase
METRIVGFYGDFEKAGFPGVAAAEKRRVCVACLCIKARSMTLHPRPSLFSVELRTARWEELIEWYRNALGLRVLVRVVDDGYALFEAGDTRLAILNRPSPGEPSQRWSLGFEVVDLDAVHARLAATDSDVTAPKLHAEGFRELITTDPDGNRIRLFSWPVGH